LTNGLLQTNQKPEQKTNEYTSSKNTKGKSSRDLRMPNYLMDNSSPPELRQEKETSKENTDTQKLLFLKKNAGEKKNGQPR